MWSPDHSPPSICKGGRNSTGCNVCHLTWSTSQTLIDLFSGMNGTRTWIMVWTLTISTHPGGILSSGRNGRSTQGHALGQVWHVSLNMYSHLMEHTDDDRTAVKDHAKTIKTPVQITTDDHGEPEIPSITNDDGYQAKVIQATLRKYCTAHIRKFYVYYMQQRFTYVH